MNKLAQVVVEEPANDTRKESDKDLHFLKEQKEDEIRMKLDQFARELSKVKSQRDKH